MTFGLTITSAGTDYAVADTLTLTGTSGVAVIEVTAIGASGGVFAWNVTSNSFAFSETGVAATGGSGTDAVFDVTVTAWEVFTTEDVLNQFTIQEAAAIRTLQGSGSGSGLPFENLDIKTAHIVDEVRGYIVAGGYAVDQVFDNTLPTGLFEDAIAIARWRYLISVPSLKQLQTEERRLAFEAAIKKLMAIAEQTFFVQPPIPEVNPRTGNWNSENKILMRTHPVPRPATQFTPQINTYANPDAPADTEQTP